MSEPPLLDEDVLDELTASIGGEGVRAVIALFLDECRELTAAMHGGDREAARRAAHSLKSSAGQLGAAALAEAAVAVETAAAAGAAELPLHVATLTASAARTRAALAARLES
ncbi:MAG: Hpt domain-containing protein [Alphaproteobacteria bacterium]|nr:Hpt domain-containing protein [Alphaproteobacteria bacterium]MBV9553090.1 Hpt domain-containing protein [Alphaproteobacteria bacterium]